MSSARSNIKCGIVLDKKTGKVKRVIVGDNKAAMLCGASLQYDDEILLRLTKEDYQKNFAPTKEDGTGILTTIDDYARTEYAKRNYIAPIVSKLDIIAPKPSIAVE